MIILFFSQDIQNWYIIFFTDVCDPKVLVHGPLLVVVLHSVCDAVVLHSVRGADHSLVGVKSFGGHDIVILSRGPAVRPCLFTILHSASAAHAQ